MSKKSMLPYAVLLLLIYLVIFLKIDAFHMRWWDESMFAVNAYEMIENGKIFSLHFDGAPDLFNTKPPLTVWLQVLCVKLLGYNELAIRLPSALATALTILLLFHFVSKYFNRFWAWISALILLTSTGFIGFHTGRTGDSDALLTLLLFLANIQFLKYIISSEKRHIIWFFIFISLSFATKLYAALLFVPAYVLLLFISKKFKDFVFNIPFVTGAIIFLASAGVLIYLRELDAHGYINQILGKDAGRIFTILDGHQGSWAYYLESLISTRFSTWFVLLMVGFFLNVFNPNQQHKKLISSSALLVMSYLTIISLSSTKLEWYDMPIYPYLALIASYPIYLMIQNFENFDKLKIPPLVKYGFISVIFFFPYYMMFMKSQSNRIPDGQRMHEAKEMYLFGKIEKNENLDGLIVFHDDYNGGLLFYQYKLREKNQSITTTNVIDFQANDRVLTNNNRLQKIETNYEFSVIDSTEFVKVVMIEGQKFE